MYKGFVNSGIVLLFVVSIVVLSFSHLFTENDLRSASVMGPIVENARWYGDGQDYVCRQTSDRKAVQNYDSFFFGKTFLRGFSRIKNKTTYSFDTNDIAEIKVEYSQNYAPQGRIEDPEWGSTVQGPEAIEMSACDADEDIVMYQAFYADEACCAKQCGGADWKPLTEPTPSSTVYLGDVSRLVEPGSTKLICFNVTMSDQEYAASEKVLLAVTAPKEE
ncbi:MAG: hypothetical protein JW834_01880 [Candidatus Diapherotrites archaeon]|nr:hypothetical protein [Candidatus Diapherotrites archaeon]